MDNKKCLWIGCQQIFSSLKGLCDHVKVDHVNLCDRVWQCQWHGCERKEPLRTMYLLVLHVRQHTGEKPNVCPHSGCFKAYSLVENLNIHMRKHTGEKPYSCNFPGCPKAFTHSSNRAKHQNRTHSDEKPYICSIGPCRKSYTDPSSLRKHIRTVHGDEEYEKFLKNNKPQNKGGRPKKQQMLTSPPRMTSLAAQYTLENNKQTTTPVSNPYDDVISPTNECVKPLMFGMQGSADSGSGSIGGGTPSTNSSSESITSVSEVSPTSRSSSKTPLTGKSFLIANILHYPEFYGAVVERLGYVFNKPLLLSLLRLHLGSHILLQRGHIALLDSIVDVYNESKEQKSSRISESSMENIMEKTSRLLISSPSQVNLCADDNVSCGFHLYCSNEAGVQFDLGPFEQLSEDYYAKISIHSLTALMEVMENCEKQREAGVEPEHVNLLFDDTSAIAYAMFCLADASQQMKDPIPSTSHSSIPRNFFQNKRHMNTVFSDLINILDQQLSDVPQENNLPPPTYFSNFYPPVSWPHPPLPPPHSYYPNLYPPPFVSLFPHQQGYVGCQWPPPMHSLQPHPQMFFNNIPH